MAEPKPAEVGRKGQVAIGRWIGGDRATRDMLRYDLGFNELIGAVLGIQSSRTGGRTKVFSHPTRHAMPPRIGPYSAT